jgi:DNA-directed RNA polymerase specialized sigma24 family protein
MLPALRKKLAFAVIRQYTHDTSLIQPVHVGGNLPMSSQGSVTRWLGPIQDGDPAAAQQLWERYFPRLVGLARKKLQSSPRRAADEEDVALSAFDSFCRNAERGLFPQLQDRDSLWRLLVVITARKAGHLLRDERRRVPGAAAPAPTGVGPGRVGLEEIVSREPSPEFAAEVAEEYERLLHSLGNSELESVALWKMEGYTNEEIAGKLGCVTRTVKRKLRIIRKIWEKETAP